MQRKQVLTPMGMKKAFNSVIREIKQPSFNNLFGKDETGRPQVDKYDIMLKFNDAINGLRSSYLLRKKYQEISREFGADAADQAEQDKKLRQLIPQEYAMAKVVQECISKVCEVNGDSSVYEELASGLNNHLRKMEQDAVRLNDNDLSSLIKQLYLPSLEPELIANPAPVEERNEIDSELHAAVKASNYDEIESMLAAGEVDVNQLIDGNTAMHLAIIKSDRRMVSLLLASEKIDLTIENIPDGKTAAKLALDMRQEETLAARNAKLADGKEQAFKSTTVSSLIVDDINTYNLARRSKTTTQNATAEHLSDKFPQNKPDGFFKKLIGYFTSMQANFSAFSSYAQLETFVYNKTYGLDSLSEKQRKDVDKKQPADPYKIYNPAYALKARVLSLNMAVRIGIDKIDSALWKRELHTKSTIAGTITKALIAGPISVVQVVVDVIAHLSDMLVKSIAGIFKKSGTTATETTAQESQPITTLEMGKKMHAKPIHSHHIDHGKAADIEMVTLTSKHALFSRKASKVKKKEGKQEHPPVRPSHQ